MAYNQQASYQPPNGRYYSSKTSELQPAPRFPPESQFQSQRAQYQQYNVTHGNHGQRPQESPGNSGSERGRYGADGYMNHGFDNAGYQEYGHGYGGLENNYDGYGNKAYNNQYYAHNQDASPTNATYNVTNGEYRRAPFAQQVHGRSNAQQPPQRTFHEQLANQQRPDLRSPPQQQWNQPNGHRLDDTSDSLQRPSYERSQSDGPRESDRQQHSRAQTRAAGQNHNPRERSKPRKPMVETAPSDTLAWDNPFPTFPTKKKSTTNDVDEIGDRMTKTSLQPTRHSEDLPRPALGGNQLPPIQTQATVRAQKQSLNYNASLSEVASSAMKPLGRGPLDRSMTTPPETMSHTQQARVPAYGQGNSHHGPDSPIYVLRNYQNFSHPPSDSSGRPGRRLNDPPRARAPEQTNNGHARQDTIEDVYNGYYDNRQHDNMSPPFQDREAEIEADMPNFDDPLGERGRLTGPSGPPSSPFAIKNERQVPDFYQQARAQKSQPDLRTQSRADQRKINMVEQLNHMPNRGYEGPNSPPYQPSGNVYSRPAYAALAQTTDLAENRSPVSPQIPTAPAALPPRLTNTPQGRHVQSPLSPHQPHLNRNQTNYSQRSDPGPGYAISPVDDDPRQRPATSQIRRPSLEQNRSNPDALPEHPTPAQTRPPARHNPQHNVTGLPQDRPAPVRQYNRVNTTVPTATTQISPQTPSTRTSNERRRSVPITAQELDRLRNTTKNNPSDQKLRLYFAKKLVEAAAVLSDEGGRVDAKTRDKNRERYILDAHKEVKKLASQGYPDAQFYLADCYGQGALGLQADTKEAFTLYQAAAKAGHGPSAYRTAVCCEMGPEEGGGTRKDPVKAVQWYKRAAALGDVPAMYKMGMILLKGLLGQQPNLGDAMVWLKRAAERADDDNPHALHELGLLYESQMPGQDKIIRDERYAFELFSRAAALRYKFSQFRLGQAYEYGLLTCPIDARQSIQWYTKAAAQSEHQSELALSGWYLTGSPGILEQSDTEAYLWARKAATADPVPLPKAMFAMGYFTEVGIGCPRSLEEAKKWYGRAAAYKFPKAQERLEELKRGGPKVQKNRERLSRSNKERNDAECVIM